MDRPQKLFLVKFFIILAVGYLIVASNAVNDAVILPFTHAITSAASVALNAMGQPVKATGTVLSSPKFGVNVNNGCNGIEAMLILLASVAAFPASWKARLGGLALGAVIIQSLNEVRIVSLWLLGAYHPSLFQVFHTAIWQIVIILSTIGFFLFWSPKIAPRLANTP